MRQDMRQDTRQDTRPAGFARSVPLPPDRPFSAGLVTAGTQITSIDSAPVARVQLAATSKSSPVEQPVRRLSPSQPLSKASYFAPADDVRGTFARNDPFATLDSQRFTTAATDGRTLRPTFSVAIGVFRDAANARRVVAALQSVPARIDSVASASGIVKPGIVKPGMAKSNMAKSARSSIASRVTAGPFESEAKALEVIRKARTAGVADARIIR